MSDYAVILAILFFMGFLSFFLALVGGSEICQGSQTVYNETWGSYTEEVVLFGWWDKAVTFYDNMTLAKCKGVPNWFGLIFLTPIISISIYMIFRLVRGGG